MKEKRHPEPDSQLNMETVSAVEPDGETYSLEEIMKEFGGWSNWDEPEEGTTCVRISGPLYSAGSVVPCGPPPTISARNIQPRGI